MALTTAHLLPLWPQDAPEAALRRELAILLSEDPDHRMRIAHIEPLLQLRLGAAWSPTRLRAALADASCAHFFAVDWASKCEWRERVIHLKGPELKAAMQQAGGSAPAAQQATATGAAAAAVGEAQAAVQPAAGAHHQSGYAAAAAAAAQPEAAGPASQRRSGDGAVRVAAMIRATWPNFEADDDEYLASAMAFVLAFRRDQKGQLPRFTLHLTDVGGHLRQFTAQDARLAAVFPRGSAGVKRGGNRPKLSEFVAAPRMRPMFRIKESPVRKGEKTITLEVGRLTRVSQLPSDPRSLLPPFMLAAMAQEAADRGGPDSGEAPVGQEPPSFDFEEWPSVQGAAASAAGAGAAGTKPQPPAPAAAAGTGVSRPLQLVTTQAPPARSASAGASAVSTPVEVPRVSDGGSSSSSSFMAGLGFGHLRSLFGGDAAAGTASAPNVVGAAALPGYSPLMGSFDLLGRSNSSIAGNAGATAASGLVRTGNQLRPTALESLIGGSLGGSDASLFAAGERSGFASDIRGQHSSGAAMSLFSDSGQMLSSSVPRGIASVWGGGGGGGSTSSFGLGGLGLGALSLGDETPKSTGLCSVPGDTPTDAIAAHYQQLDALVADLDLEGPGPVAGGGCGTTTGCAAHVGGGCGSASGLDAPGDAQVTSSYGSDWSSSFFAHSSLREAAPGGGQQHVVLGPSRLQRGASGLQAVAPPSPFYTPSPVASPLCNGKHGCPDQGPGSVPASPAAASMQAASSRPVIRNGASPAGLLGPDTPALAAEQAVRAVAAPGSTGSAGNGSMASGGSSDAPKLTGWASVAAKGPAAAPAGPVRSSSAGRELAPCRKPSPSPSPADGSAPHTPNGAAPGSNALHKLPPRVRGEVESLVERLQGVLKVEDFDDGVVHQLNLKSDEEEAVAAVRHLGHYDLAHIQHMAAYINHIIKHYGSSSGASAAGGSSIGAHGGQIRLASVPLSTKAMLQKLPLRVYRRLEAVVGQCDYLDWRHFDAGVVKVLAQLARLAEEDVFEELGQLTTTDLSNVEYMPAYLNKRLNNRLWARRKEAGTL